MAVGGVELAQECSGEECGCRERGRGRWRVDVRMVVGRVAEFGVVWLQIVLLVVAMVAVPWMLFPKPLILRKQHIQVQASSRAV